jgi:hypothetical protein
MQIDYDINSFKWDQRENTFYADVDNVYAMDDVYSSAESFPSGRGQFNIRNQETGGFRRFSFVREMEIIEPDWNSIQWLFRSEDEQPYLCIVNVPVLF